MSGNEALQAVKSIPAWAVSLAISLLVAGVPFGAALLRMGSFEGAVGARLTVLEEGQQRLETKLDSVMARGEADALIRAAVETAMSRHESLPGHQVMVERVSALSAQLEGALARIRSLEEGR